MYLWGRVLVWVGALVTAMVASGAPRVVINEIHYNPDVKTERVEFLELFNTTSNTIDLAGWSITDGVSYTFPTNATIAPFGFKVIAAVPAAVQSKYGLAGALGPYTGALSKWGEKITIKNALGEVENSVEYGLGFPWPTVGDAPGYSIELINPNLDNNLGGSWRASYVGSAQGATTLVSDHSSWSYFKGRSEASTPSNLWRQVSFNDSAWSVGQSPIGYGETFIATQLTDMRSNYTTVFFRKAFVVQTPGAIQSLQIDAQLDDGAKIWINGTNVLNINVPNGELAYTRTASSSIEATNFTTYYVTNLQNLLVAGTNVIAVQALNQSLTASTDFVMDMRVIARSGPVNIGPTPGRTNICFATNAAPQIRQVDHTPSHPRSGELVKITAKVTDPDGVTNVFLQYQLVAPGSYIEISDSSYSTSWISVPMNDGGTNGDLLAGDGTYSADLPPSLQIHRRLIRYRITANDSGGRSIRVPYEDDPQPNFAYFVYDGVPAWSGAVVPGAVGTNGYVFTASSNEMNRLPVYHFIAKSNSFATAIGWAPGQPNNQYGGDNYLWKGTLIVDGKVYDHVGFRARGGIWRYSMGKNAMKFALNRGHDLEVKDNWGRKKKVPWRRLSLRPNIQQASYLHRGEQGMFESVGYRLFQLAGTPALNTVQVQFRVIDDSRETVPGNQYQGDFYGLWLVVEEEDGRFLEERGMEDGNIYDMENWTGTLNHTGELGPTDRSDLDYFIISYTNTVPTEAWWRTNLDLNAYYGFHTMIQGIHDFDVAAGKNYFYYRNSASGLWQIWPWDLDLCWADNMGGVTGGDEPFKSKVLSNFSNPGVYPKFGIEFRNRVRHIRDLLYNTDEGWKVIDEHWWLTRGYEQWSITDADRALWDYNPVMTNTAVVLPAQAGQGNFYRWTYEPGTSNNFAGAAQIMKKFIGTRGTNTSYSLDTMSADTLRPARPSVTYTGPADYPINRLTFRTSSYSGTNAFASIQWRIAEITDPNALPFDPNDPRKYEIDAVTQTTNTIFANDTIIPPANLKSGHRYRVRAQFKDVTGRTSNWSLPVEFTLGEPSGAADLQNYLRITEVMFHPAPGGYEYIEIHNSSAYATLDLAGVKFTQGVDYTFPSGALMGPNTYALVVGTTNVAAFRAFYNLDPEGIIFSAYAGSLDNAGEQITLRTSAGGSDIVSFKYSDGRGWPTAADGVGHSIVYNEFAEYDEATGAGDYGGNWRASAYLRGSPGRAETVAPSSLVINEIMANTDPTNGWISNDWIELYNPTPNDITFGPGWYLSDDPTALTKWQIPANTFIPAHGWVTFDEITGFHNPTNTGFGLSSAGEQIFLSYIRGTAEDRVVDSLDFKAQEKGVSLARYPDGAAYWYASPPTRGAANELPLQSVVINEVMYHPPDIGGTNDNALDEYIEVWNPTVNSIPLFNTNGNWRIAGDVDFSLPSMSLSPNQLILLVSFSPADTAQMTAFKNRYGLNSTPVLILGPYTGKLPNSSGRVALEKPQPKESPTNSTPWAIVDEVIYSDQSPWPCGSDGTGLSLHRYGSLGHGRDFANWTSGETTAGRAYVSAYPGAPTITVQPFSAVVPTNANVVFSVGVCSGLPVTYQWQRNETNLLGATASSYSLFSVQAADSGDYRVVISNVTGAVTSQVATLNVQDAPFIVSQPQSTTVVGYSNATFEVQATGSDPLQYQWRFNGADIPGATSATMTLSNVQAYHAGVYSVRVFNVGGMAVSSNAVLTVIMPAQIVTQPASISTNAGSNVTFQVVATGQGTLTYQWRRNGTNILGATASSFSLTNVQIADQAVYSVVVADAVGPMVSDGAMLTVILRPAIVIHPSPVTVLEGGYATISVVATGTPPLHYRWRKGSVLYIIDGPASITFPAASIADAGAYNCFVYSGTVAGGALSSNANLTVLSDFDADGMADEWEVAHGFDTNNSADSILDFDADGMNNHDEFVAGTDPGDPASFLNLSVSPTDETPGAGAVLQFNAISNRTYNLQLNLGPNSWTNLATFPAAVTNRWIIYSNRPPGDLQFYRLQIPSYP